MSPESFARSFTQAFATRPVMSDTSFSATARPGRRSESRSGRARLTESGAIRRHDRIRLRVEQATGGTMQSVERYDVLFFDVRDEE
jgi:hypothetical protein